MIAAPKTMYSMAKLPLHFLCGIVGFLVVFMARGIGIRVGAPPTRRSRRLYDRFKGFPARTVFIEYQEYEVQPDFETGGEPWFEEPYAKNRNVLTKKAQLGREWKKTLLDQLSRLQDAVRAELPQASRSRLQEVRGHFRHRHSIEWTGLSFHDTVQVSRGLQSMDQHLSQSAPFRHEHRQLYSTTMMQHRDLFKSC